MTTTIYRSFSGSMDGGNVRLTAWQSPDEDDPISVVGNVCEDFGRYSQRDAIAWLVGKGCDPMHAQFIVKTAALGTCKVEVFPSEGRVVVVEA